MSDKTIQVKITNWEDFYPYFNARHKKPAASLLSDEDWVRDKMIDWLNRKGRAGFVGQGNLATTWVTSV